MPSQQEPQNQGYSAPFAKVVWPGKWGLQTDDGKLLLRVEIPLTDGSHLGNQFPVTAQELGVRPGATEQTAVHFSIARDAGTFYFEGTIEKGVGKGTVRSFTPNASVIATDANVVHGMTDLDAVKAALFNVNTTFASEVTGLFPNANMDQVVEFDVFGVTPEYIRSMQQYFPSILPKEVTHLKAAGVDLTYVAGLSALKIADITPSGVLALKIAHLDVGTIRRVTSGSETPLTVQKIISEAPTDLHK